MFSLIYSWIRPRRVKNIAYYFLNFAIISGWRWRWSFLQKPNEAVSKVWFWRKSQTCTDISPTLNKIRFADDPTTSISRRLYNYKYSVHRARSYPLLKEIVRGEGWVLFCLYSVSTFSKACDNSGSYNNKAFSILTMYMIQASLQLIAVWSYIYSILVKH